MYNRTKQDINFMLNFNSFLVFTFMSYIDKQMQKSNLSIPKDSLCMYRYMQSIHSNNNTCRK